MPHSPNLMTAQGWLRAVRNQWMGVDICPDTLQGFCVSIGMLGLKAILSKQLQRFKNRLTSLYAIKKKYPEFKFDALNDASRFEAIFNECELANMPHIVQHITDIMGGEDQLEEASLEEIINRLRVDYLSFLNGLELDQAPFLHEYVFESLPIAQFQMPALSLLQNSENEKQGGLVKVNSFTGAYTPTDWQAYFRSLREAIHQESQATTPVTLFLRTYSHAIAVSFDPIKQEWTFINANKMADLFKDPTVKQDVEIAKLVSEGFFNEPNQFVSTTVYTLGNNVNEIKAHLERWKQNPEWKKMHVITEEKAAARNAENSTWLHLATVAEDMDALSTLCQLKINLDLPEAVSKATPLYSAVLSRSERVMEELLEAGANPNIGAGEHDTPPLSYAIQEGQTHLVKLLLKYGAKYDHKRAKDAVQPLYLAAYYNQVEMIHALLEAGADINAARKNDLMTPLAIAIANGNVEAVQALLERGANPNQEIIFEGESKTPLRFAVELRQRDMLALLQKQGARMNATPTPREQFAFLGGRRVESEKPNVELRPT